MEKIFRTYVFKHYIIFVPVKDNVEIFSASYTMMMIAFRAHKKVFTQFGYCADVPTFGTFAPEPFRRFLLFGSTGENSFFDSLEPTTFRLLTLAFFPGQVRFKILF